MNPETHYQTHLGNNDAPRTAEMNASLLQKDPRLRCWVRLMVNRSICRDRFVDTFQNPKEPAPKNDYTSGEYDQQRKAALAPFPG
jgi:hypothetical protein